MFAVVRSVLEPVSLKLPTADLDAALGTVSHLIVDEEKSLRRDKVRQIIVDEIAAYV